jgi:hypothetical protein
LIRSARGKSSRISAAGAVENAAGSCSGTSNGSTYTRSTLSHGCSDRTAASIVSAAISRLRALAAACRSATTGVTYGSAVLP